LCGLRWTLKPGKVQGIEKTCRLNTALSNFLDPTPEGFLFPEISLFPAQTTHVPRPLEPSERPRGCTTPCYHANLKSIVSMGRFEIFSDSLRRRGEAGTLEPGAWASRGRGGRRFVAGEGLAGADGSRASAAPPLPCSRPFLDGPADVPMGAPGRVQADFQAAKRPIVPIDQVAMG
jgi:hypothetical protein